MRPVELSIYQWVTVAPQLFRDDAAAPLDRKNLVAVAMREKSSLTGRTVRSQTPFDCTTMKAVDEELVTIDRFLFPGDAALAKAALDASGIDAFLADENIARMSWVEAVAHGGVRLQVRRSDAPLAIAMLTAENVRSFDIEDNAGDQTPSPERIEKCLRCASEEIYPAESRARTYARALVFCFGGVMLVNLASCTMLLMHARAPERLFSALYLVALTAPLVAVLGTMVLPRKHCRNCNAVWRGVQRIS